MSQRTMVVHMLAHDRDEPAMRSLTLYTTIPVLFLTGDQVDTVLKVLQFWRTHCRELYARHKAAIQRLNGLITLYDGRMCDTSLSNKAFPDHICVSSPGGPSIEVKPHQLSNQPLHDMGLRALAPLCAAYDHQAHDSPAPVITIRRVKDVCIALLRLAHFVPQLETAMQRDMRTSELQAVAEETLQFFTQPQTAQEAEYSRNVARLCEEVDDRLTRGLQGVRISSDPPSPSRHAIARMHQVIAVPSTLVSHQSPRPRQESQAGPRSRQSEEKSSSRTPRREGDGHRNRSRSRDRHRSRSPARNTHHQLPPPPPPVIHIPDIAPGGRSGGSRVLGKRTYKRHEEAWSPPRSPAHASPGRREQARGGSQRQANMSRRAMLTGDYECDLAKYLLEAGIHGRSSDTLLGLTRSSCVPRWFPCPRRDLPAPKGVLDGTDLRAWLTSRRGLFDLQPGGTLALQPKSMAGYRRPTLEAGVVRHDYLLMETRAYEFSLCWFLAKNGPHLLKNIKDECPIPRLVLVAADGAVNFVRDRSDLYEYVRGLVHVRHGWRAQLGLPELPA